VAELSESAFGEFYHATSRSLWAYVYRMTGNAADAGEIVQESFCRLLRADVAALASEDLRRYVFRTASNLVVDRWRRATRERAVTQHAGHESVVQPVAGRDDGLARVFAQLGARDRALLWLAYVEEQDHREMAGALGVRRSSVKILLSRARSRLRHLLRTPAARMTVGIR
jgi:RNA polymerase sigma-70 factor (ECF subfamily)